MSGRILIIDPNAQRRMLLKSLLLEEFYLVDMVTDMADPMLAVRAKHADLIFLACDPENSAALPTLRQLHTQARQVGVPIIATGPEQACAARLLTAGADDAIIGHPPAKIWHARLRRLIRQKRTQDELRLREETAGEFGFEPEIPEVPKDGTHSVTLFSATGPKESAFDRRLSACPMVQVTKVNAAAAALAQCTADPQTTLLLRVFSRRSGMHAMQLIARLRSAPRTRFTPAIMVIDPAEQGVAIQGLDIGASDFVMEDISIEELTARLSAHRRRFIMHERLRADLVSGLEMAMTDPLTRLLNRRYATTHIPRLMTQAVDAKQPFSLMLIDIDNFKLVNDRYGHAAGDTVLVEVAQRLRSTVRSIDLVARFGGEEFLVALPRANPAVAAQVAERVRAAVAMEPITVRSAKGNETELTVTVSVGIAQADAQNDEAFEAVFSCADLAMYQAKRDGRNRISQGTAAA